MSEVFADVQSEGATLDIDKSFDRLSAKEDKPASESHPEKKETDKPAPTGENTSEEKTPFHKHPRWQKMQEEFKATREELERIKAERAQSKPVELPQWWKDRYGDTDESKKSYESVVQKDGELDWIKQQVKEELKAESQTETNTVKEADEYVNTQLAEMTEEGLKFERNQLLKFMVDFQEEYGAGALLDKDGNYDFRKSLTLMGKMQPKEEDTSNAVRKQVASLSGRGKAPSQQQSTIPVLSRNALRRGNWRDADTGQFTSK